MKVWRSIASTVSPMETSQRRSIRHPGRRRAVAPIPAGVTRASRAKLSPVREWALVLIVAVAACTSQGGTPTGAPSAAESSSSTMIDRSTNEPGSTKLVKDVEGVWGDSDGIAVADGTTPPFSEHGLTINVSAG